MIPMGINIEWAKINHNGYAKIEREEREERKLKVLQSIRNELDKQISLNIHTIIIQPCYLYLSVDFSSDDMLELKQEYIDFTIEFYPPHYRNTISIKLADKDWDWGGYGIKNEAPKEEHKKKIFNWFKL